MNRSFLGSGWLAVAACCCLVPAAFADTVDMRLTSVGNSTIMANTYVNPYTATVNGVATTVICDDYAAETWINESWQATVHTLSDLTGTRWGSVSDAQHLYNAAAWLTLQLLTPNLSKVTQGEISFAIWGLFTPSAVTTNLASSSATYAAAATQWMTTALAQTTNSVMSEFANFVIYTPIAGTATNCGGRACTGLPQEFIAVRVPETAALPLLGFNILALAGILLVFRRRIDFRA